MVVVLIVLAFVDVVVEASDICVPMTRAFGAVLLLGSQRFLDVSVQLECQNVHAELTDKGKLARYFLNSLSGNCNLQFLVNTSLLSSSRW